MEKQRTMSEAYADLETKVAQGNEAIKNGTLTADFLASFAEIEKEYSTLAAKATYQELGKMTKPMIAAIRRYSYKVWRHEEIKDSETKLITKIELTQKDRQIDLLKFCHEVGLDEDWQYDVAGFNQSLCLRAAKELGYSQKELDQLARSYYLKKQLEEIKRGKTPVSNNALCKMLQRVIDAILPPNDEEIGNCYKCNNHDLAYLLMCYTKKSSKFLSVAIAKDGYLRNLIMDILHRIITGQLYTIDYKTKKDMKPVERVAKPQEVEPAVMYDDQDEDDTEILKAIDEVIAA